MVCFRGNDSICCASSPYCTTVLRGVKEKSSLPLYYKDEGVRVTQHPSSLPRTQTYACRLQAYDYIPVKHVDSAKRTSASSYGPHSPPNRRPPQTVPRICVYRPRAYDQFNAGHHASAKRTSAPPHGPHTSANWGSPQTIPRYACRLRAFNSGHGRSVKRSSKAYSSTPTHWRWPHAA